MLNKTTGKLNREDVRTVGIHVWQGLEGEKDKKPNPPLEKSIDNTQNQKKTKTKTKKHMK